MLAAALLVLAYPLYRARTQSIIANAAALDDLLAQRDGVYATLRDLDMDKQLGKLDNADYTALHERYMSRAAEILQDLDTLRGEGRGAEASAEIEREVAAMRVRPQTVDPSTESRAGSEPQKVASDKISVVSSGQPADQYCTNCGRPYHAGDRFCARCGRALS